ncbi:patatin-like phospholipase family protein [Desulfohalobium retbaense]|uniref:Patatin n=1 Tax=Desulfohalobium retbaense (strain ATCC 49708 / DSM 5692 / JCM 16813 / HR100) TaxID=485915 RepID=C8X1W0_DESRD|nr:patatin-like phospholipase family protein [Desulfohalobium retbaense]ACV68532.1 Patatin [Desulfohalobium retbaense DSM 5692]
MRQMSRRMFLQLCSGLAASGALLQSTIARAVGTGPDTTLSPEEPMSAPKTIGLALGAGGANGLAHIRMLEVFDELGIRPHKIAGSSIGAIIGALYASGLSAKEIGEVVNELVVREEDTWKDVFVNKDIFKWIEFLDPELGQGGLVSSDAFLSFLFKQIRVESFEALTIPLAVVATDFWQRRAVVFDKGLLLSAVQGSMALPGLFTPVRRDGLVLIDGGAVNPVPYDILAPSCEATIAVDVAGKRSPKKDLSFLDTIFNTFQIMQHSIVAEKTSANPPDISIVPDIVDIRALEFYKVDTIYRQAKPAKDQLKRELSALLER